MFPLNLINDVVSIRKYFLFRTHSLSFCISSEDERGMSGPNNQTKRNRFLPLTEGVTACAVHPLNGTIVAGTKVCGWEGSIVLFLLYE